jgi:hypothetical protein
MKLRLNSDDGVEVYLDGRKLESKNVFRDLNGDPDEVQTLLTSGEHQLLFKVANRAGGWGFRSQIETGVPVDAHSCATGRFSQVFAQAHADPTYASIKSNIFDVRCVKCHGKPPVGDKVPLEPLSSLLASPRQLVLPGNSAESGLFIAISRTDDKRMPPPREGAPLSPDEIQTIGAWIDQGAKP